mmetsp:Transcript_13846/g.33532  ORF Transcript_13846/g.33532 Transcript_13846/m.33532 type:complete len:80 (+) Transcript_13846:250-489(+)
MRSTQTERIPVKILLPTHNFYGPTPRSLCLIPDKAPSPPATLSSTSSSSSSKSDSAMDVKALMGENDTVLRLERLLLLP